jgi:phosphoserine phosphatase
MQQNNNDKSWQLKTPIDAVVFDCDGTLSELEGINELAQKNAVLDEVANLTDVAMSETGITNDIYQQRISLTKPTKQQVLQLGQDYFFKRSLDLMAVLEVYQKLNKALFIVSAGVNPAVKIFAELIEIPVENVYAVDLFFDKQGNFKDYDRQSPLTDKHGKAKILAEIKKRFQRVAHIGDGMNDFEAGESSTRFIGYGGVYYREKLARQCDYYIQSASLLPMLPLTLCEDELELLTADQRDHYYDGLELMQRDAVIMIE